MNISPHNLDAETNVLGSILMAARTVFSEVAGVLAPDDFYHPAHRAIYRACEALDDAAKPIDAVTVADQMRHGGDGDVLNAQGGMATYLEQLLCSVVTIGNAMHHAKTIRSKSERRRWIAAAHEIAALGYEDTDDAEYMAAAERKVLELTSRGRSSDGPKHIKPIMHAVITAMNNRYERRSAINGVTTGFSELDDSTNGLKAGELVILAGRPSMGKSAFAMNMAAAAIGAGTPCLVFSLEMSDESLAERLVASQGRIDASKMRTGKLSRSDWMDFTRSTSKLVEQNLWLDDTATLSIADIRSRARRWRMQGGKSEGPGLVIVDYLQLASSRRKGKESNREQEIADISRGLKALAKELGCPVVALSQLNRSLESRADKRPMMSDLRESGSLEQDADLICFLYRDEVYNPKSPDAGIAEVIIAKQRNGPTGIVRLAWLPNYGRFENTTARTYQ